MRINSKPIATITLVITMLVSLSSCNQPLTEEPTVSNNPNSVEATESEDVSSSANPTTDLSGTSWQLVQFQGSNDTTLTPDDPSKYTITFEADNQVSLQVDCNQGRGTWTTSAPNQLQFSELALTRAICPPGSLHDRIVQDWTAVRSYVIEEGHLFLSLMADGGIYEFEPMNR